MTAGERAGAERSESPDAGRKDVNEQRERYRELLEELRTIIPGVQVLLAFLLTVPFASRFAELDQVGKALFTVSLTAAALSVVVFLVPAVYHRLTSHARRSERIQVGVRSTLWGLALLAVSIVAALFVVARFIYDTTVGSIVAGSVSAAILGLWLVLPVSRRRSRTGGG